MNFKSRAVSQPRKDSEQKQDVTILSLFAKKSPQPWILEKSVNTIFKMRSQN